MTRKLIELVGEQPILNLLPIRAIKPDEVLFVGTRKRHDTIKHLKSVLRKEINVHTLTIHDAFDSTAIYRDLAHTIKELGWTKEGTAFDLSGGNRIMSVVAYELAKWHKAVIADLERIGHRYRLRLYSFGDEYPTLKNDIELPGLISISDYIHAHLPGFDVDGFSKDERGRIDDGGLFEECLFHALEPQVDEILAGVRPAGAGHQIEIDLVVRKRNTIGIIEAKTGIKKAGIDQLDTAANPTYLGKYVVKILITGRRLPRNTKELAVAQRIHVIELPGYDVDRGLSGHDSQFLKQRIKEIL